MNRELLEKQFDKKQIKKRKGNFGDMIDYVDIQLIIKRLNDAFEHNWNFEIIDNKILDEEVIVTGKMTAENITKMQFGTSQITRNAKTNKAISIGDDLKSATSDCLKKCASMFGVALHIYGDSDISQPPVEQKKDDPQEQPTESIPEKAEKKAKETLAEGTTESYFARIKEVMPELANDTIRHKWQEEMIGKSSTATWTQDDYRKAFDLLDTEERRQIEESHKDELKELPKFDMSKANYKYTSNGANNPITDKQINYVSKLLYEARFKASDVSSWTCGYCSYVIEFLLEDKKRRLAEMPSKFQEDEQAQDKLINLVNEITEETKIEAYDINQYLNAKYLCEVYSDHRIAERVLIELQEQLQDKFKKAGLLSSIKLCTIFFNKYQSNAFKIQRILKELDEKDTRAIMLYFEKLNKKYIWQLQSENVREFEEDIKEIIQNLNIEYSLK